MANIKLTKTELHFVDTISSFILDDLRDVLVKYKKYCPNWNYENLEYNFDDRIYESIHDDIRHEYERRKANIVSQTK